ncbi:MAG: ATP-binding protein [Candidatus Geothermarchaeales archaeon]
MDEIGVVVSPSGMNVFELVLTERAGLTRGDYCVFKHPVSGSLCLARIFAGSAKNPEMFSLSFGALLAKRGIKMGNEQEVVVLKAEALGYMDADGSFNRMDFPPSPGSTVHRADETLIRHFLKYQRGLQIDVGVDPYSGIPIQLSLDLLTKGHVSICGMTRSGKTSFVMSLIEACSTKVPAGRFLVFDRYGEYNPLVANGMARILDYRELQSLQSLRRETIASMFGLTTERASGRFLATAVRDIIQYGGEIDRENILSLAEKHVKRDRSRILGEIEASLNRHRKNLEKLTNMSYESPSVVRLLTEKPVIIIDLSTDPDIRGQQTVLTSVLEELFAAATASKGEEFTCLVVVEEAQFYAPEKGAPTFGDPFGTKSLDMLAACCSQLGGYNIGFMIMTQRPAYVSKALLAQCNTHLVFRLMSGADHDQIASVTGYPKNRISELVSGLKDHRALIVGMAAPFEFPVFIETDVRRYPQKATITASEVLEKIETIPQLKSRL